MSRKALLIVDHHSYATQRVREGLVAITSQKIESANPADAIIRLRIHEFDSVLLCGSLSAAERSELWIQISQQAMPPRVVCIGGSDTTRPYSNYSIFQPVRLASMPEPAALAKALALQLSESVSSSKLTAMNLRLIGKSEAVLDIRRLIERFSETRSPVLIMGETGTGRRLIARQIHDASERCGAPFVEVDCATLGSADVLEVLFADTDSAAKSVSKLEQAQGGTLLLRNIASLPLNGQQALAAILADKQYFQVGSQLPQPLRTRVVATTSKQLKQVVKQRQFSKNLFHQLEAFPISVPPLRERVEDIPLMVAHLTCAMRHRHGADIRFTSAAMDCLLSYHWPGNQQEMLNLLQDFAALRTSSQLGIQDLPANIRSCAAIRRLQDRPKATHPAPVAGREPQVTDKGMRTAFRGIGHGAQPGSPRQYNLNREGITAKIAG